MRAFCAGKHYEYYYVSRSLESTTKNKKMIMIIILVPSSYLLQNLKYLLLRIKNGYGSQKNKKIKKISLASSKILSSFLFMYNCTIKQ